MRKGGVAFFDSGIGGLTVLAACRKALPNVTFYYYGDNRHAPYGNLSAKKICRYVFRAFRRFKRLKVSAVVLACNTATAVCIDALRKRYDFPIIGTEPALRVAAKRSGRVWVLSTRATYESERFQALCRQVEAEYPSVCITAYPCDGLAGAIERGIGGEEVDVSPYLPQGTPQTVVLGCTHYPFVRERIEKFYGCETVDGNEGIARRLKFLLGKRKVARKEKEKISTKPLKNRFDHRRPLFLHFAPQIPLRQPRFFRKKQKILLRQNLNKRSFFQKNKNAEPREIKGGGRIFFLGRSKKRNENTYKQMFG